MDKNKWFQDLYEAYQLKKKERIIQLLDLVILKDNKFFNTNKQLKIQPKFKPNDEVGPFFFKTLQQLYNWSVSKYQHSEGQYTSFSKYVSILHNIKQSFQYIRSQNDKWFIEIIKHLLRRTKQVFIRAKNVGLKYNRSEESLLQTVIDVIRDYSRKFNTEKDADQFSRLTRQHIEPLTHNLSISLHLSACDYSFCLKKLKIKINIDVFPQQQKKIYYFYRGKILMIGMAYFQAIKCFNRLQNLCWKRNRLMLRYLVPCNLLIGICPDQQLLKYYQLGQYLLIRKYMMEGQIGKLEQEIERWQRIWIQRGIYLFMNKLKLICWRNLVKKVYKITNQYKIQLDYFKKAFDYARYGQKKDHEHQINQVACILGNLIFMGLVKGYIYHSGSLKSLVLKKQNPFPKISQCLKQFPQNGYL